MFDVTRIVGIFQDDEHPETYGVGILNEDGDDLLLQETDPVVIIEMANRLVRYADEIIANQQRHFEQAEDVFRGYPAGTTLGDIISNRARKIVSAVED